MISFKSFIAAINDAIVQAGDSLMDKNVQLLNQYFTEQPDEKDPAKKNLVPKTVTLEYPAVGSDLQPVIRKVDVPLITLVPLTASRIEKATLTADFEMEMADGQVQLNFTSKSNRRLFKNPRSSIGRLEITITPQPTPEGLNALIEAYESVVKAQLP